MKLETVLLIAACLLGIVCVCLCGALFSKISRNRERNTEMMRQLQEMRREITNEQSQSRQENINNFERLAGILQKNIESSFARQDSRLAALTSGVSDSLHTIDTRFKDFSLHNEQKLDNIRTTVENRLTSLQQDNNKQLEQMRATVDERLQKTLEDKLNASFNLVSERLEQVYKGLGEMQTLASGVGDLKKVLSNVKTRGILGEIQLGAILEQIMTPEQYDREVATRPNSRDHVEYAVKLPGDGGSTVYLPIDAKFPLDAYNELTDAYEQGDAQLIDAATKQLVSRIKGFAKDIHDKYIEPPYTTDFAVLFLPVEGLYAEVTRQSGLVESLQRDYKVNIAGPTTMAALLNSLQMGFRTLAIQKRSSEVWKVLGAVKTEFNTFATVLDATQQRITQAGAELDKLVGVRTRQIQKKLSSVTELSDTEESSRLLEDK